MPSKNQTLGRILQTGFLPNFINDPLDPLRLAEAAREAGIRALEISGRRADTLAALAKLKNEFPDMSFGVASLVEDGPYYDFLQKRGPTFPSVSAAAESGADFLVSMIAFNASTYRRHKSIPIVPGVETPQEAKIQLDYGASLVKFSGPALKGGPAYFKALVNCAPLHFGLPLLLTGGLRPELIDQYIAAGMLVAVAGFDLILGRRYQEMQKKPEWKFARNSLKDYVRALREGRARHMAKVNFASADPVLIQRQSGRFLNV